MREPRAASSVVLPERGKITLAVDHSEYLDEVRLRQIAVENAIGRHLDLAMARVIIFRHNSPCFGEIL